MVDNTIALGIQPLKVDLATPLMQASQIRQAALKEQEAQMNIKRGQTWEAAQRVSALPESDRPAAWDAEVMRGAKEGWLSPDEAQRNMGGYSPLRLHSMVNSALTPEQGLHREQLAETTRQHGETIALGKAQLAETRRQHDIEANAPKPFQYGAGLYDRHGKIIREPGVTDGANYDPNPPAPPGGVPSPTAERLPPIKPPSMAGTSSDALAAEGERYALTGKVGQGYTNNRDPIAAAQARAIKTYGIALAKSRGIGEEELAQMWQNSPKWAGWLMGQDGRVAGSLGTVIDHLDTARELMRELHNGNFNLGNELKNKFKAQFGYDAPTNVQAASQVIGTEVMKAIGAAGAGGQDERASMAKAVGDLGKSPAQSEGAITTLEKLVAGQMRTKQRQAEAIDLPKGKFEKLVGKRALDVLSNIDNKSGGTTTPVDTSSGTTSGNVKWKLVD